MTTALERHDESCDDDITRSLSLWDGLVRAGSQGKAGQLFSESRLIRQAQKPVQTLVQKLQFPPLQAWKTAGHLSSRKSSLGIVKVIKGHS